MSDAREPDVGPDAGLGLQLGAQDAWMDLSLPGVVETLSDGVITTDETQTIVMANRAAKRMFGREDLIGLAIDALIPARFRARHERDMEAFGRAEVGSRAMGHRPEVTGQRADGQEFPLDTTISLATANGRLLFTAVLRDMTEVREAERERDESRAKLDAALSSMTDSIVICDTTGRAIEFNDAFVTFHRFSRREECPPSVHDYQEILELRDPDGELVSIEQRPVARALRGESGTNAEYRLRRRDTGETWVGSYSFSPIRAADGSVVGSVIAGRDITDLREAQIELEVSHAALRHLVAEQDRVQEEERKRIARELHDELAQMLAMVRINIGQAGRVLVTDPGRAATLLADTAGLATDAIASTRRLINDLRPPALEQLGLAEAIRSLAADFSRRTGILSRVDDDGVEGALSELPSDVAVCLYRIAQEALNNIAKHSGAARATLGLFGRDDDRLALRIRDDGAGFETGELDKPGSFGIRGMSERLRAINGELTITAERDRGTMVLAIVPRRESQPVV